MGDALAKKVTHCDALGLGCVTPHVLIQERFTTKVTQVTQICRKVPNARPRGGELLQKCVTVRSASPFELDKKEYRR